LLKCTLLPKPLLHNSSAILSSPPPPHPTPKFVLLGILLLSHECPYFTGFIVSTNAIQIAFLKRGWGRRKKSHRPHFAKLSGIKRRLKTVIITNISNLYLQIIKGFDFVVMNVLILDSALMLKFYIHVLKSNYV
jgi:hypothetical protein